MFAELGKFFRKVSRRADMRFLILVLAGVFAVPAVFGQSFGSAPFPRLGVYAIGSPHDYETEAQQEALSRYSVIILNSWPNWEGGRGVNIEQVARRIKARNSKARIFIYVNNMEFDAGGVGVWGELNAKLDANKWWLYRSGGDGTRLATTWGPNHFAINVTRFTPRDSSGRTYAQWFAKHVYDLFIKPSPSIDGIYFDNVFWKPRIDGDWNRDGVTDSADDPQVAEWWRQGMRDQIDALRALAPGKLILGNTADWGDSAAVFPEFSGLLDGSVMENLAGLSYSPETWGGWHVMMSWYRKQISALREPRLAIFHHEGRADDLRSFRYGLGSSLLDDGYFFYNPNFSRPFAVFDEYQVSLGAALSSPPRSAWKQGVFRRDFEGGIVLVNPKGNGAVTLELDGEYRHIQGTQDRAVNSGALTRRLTLADRDGVILLRVAPRALPLPPKDVRVE